MKKALLNPASRLLKALPLVITMMTTGLAQATTLSFTEIVNDGGPDLSSQLAVDVTNLGSNNVGFTFFNGRDAQVTIDSIIGGIFFDVGSSNVSSISYSAPNSSDGVLFTAITGQASLPEGNTLDPAFTNDAGYKFGHDKNIATGNGTGVDDANGGSAEFASFIATFDGNFLFNDLINNLFSGDFRLGLHVISIEDEPDGDADSGGSDAYVTVSTVPVPAAAWLFGSALLGLFATRRANYQKMLTNS